MEENKEGYFYVIPSEIMWNNELKDKSKLLYGLISNLCNKNGICFASNKYIASLFGCSERTITDLINDLVDKDYIYVEIKDFNNREIGMKNISRGLEKNFYGDRKNLLHNNNTIIKDNNNKENIKRKEDIEEIINYLNSKVGSHYRSNIGKTISTINARFKEGFKVEDFKKVIDIKCKDWLYNKDMKKYLRPETLFGNKMEGYLNQYVEVKEYRIGDMF